MTTTYERVTKEYDAAHERALLIAISNAVIRTSKLNSDAMLLRPRELTSALLQVLATAIVLSPKMSNSPAALRKTLNELGKRLRQHMARAQSDPEFQHLRARWRFNEADDVEGNT